MNMFLILLYRWQQAAFQTVTFEVPNNWKAGRIWGRRNCDFSVNPGPNSCATGGCNGGLLCDPHTGTVSLHDDYQTAQLFI